MEFKFNCSPRRLFILPCLWAAVFLTVFFSFPTAVEVNPTTQNVPLDGVFGTGSNMTPPNVSLNDVFGVWSNTSTNSSSPGRSLLSDMAEGDSEESNRVTKTSSRADRRSGPPNAPPKPRPSPSPPSVDSKKNPPPSPTSQSPSNSESFSPPPPYSHSLSSPPDAFEENPPRNSPEIPSAPDASGENPTPPDNNFKTSSSSPIDNVQKSPLSTGGDGEGVYVHTKIRFNLPSYNVAGEGWMNWNPSAKNLAQILGIMTAISFAFQHILTSLCSGSWDWCYKFFVQKNTEGIQNPPINPESEELEEHLPNI